MNSLFDGFPGVLAGPFHTEGGGPGLLAALRVHAGLFAQILRVAEHVQQIVVDLERQPDAETERLQRRNRLFVRARDIGRSQQRRRQQVGRLVRVNVLQRRLVRLAVLAEQINALSGHHAAHTRASRDLLRRADMPRRVFSPRQRIV